MQGVAGAFINDIYDVTAGQDLGYSRGGVISGNGAAVSWTVEPNIPAGHVIRLTIEGVTNPAAGSHDLQVSTSADPTVVDALFTTTTPGKLTAPSVSLAASTAAHATDATYTVQFKTSSTGALAPGNGQITLAAPAGTAFPEANVEGVAGAFINDIYDVTAGQDLGFSRGGAVSHGGAIAIWTVEPEIPAGHVIRLTIEGVTNPGAGSGYHFQISTSSDPASVTTPSYSITPQRSLTSAYIAISQPAVSRQTSPQYEIQFTTSSTGRLVPNYGQIIVTAPLGTVFPVGTIEGVYGAHINDVYDVTTGQDFGDLRGGAVSGGGSTVTWTVGTAIGPDQVIDLTIDGVTNPTGGTYKLGVATSSDIGIQTASYTVSGTSLPVISGTISYNGGSGLTPVAGSVVQACDDATCVAAPAPTDSNGGYWMYLPSPGSYTVTAFAPTSDAYSVGEGSSAPVSMTDKSVTTVNVTLPPLPPLSAGITIAGQSAGTVPAVPWGDSAPVSVTGCRDGTAVSVVTSIDSQTGETSLAFGGLTETPAGSGLYTGTIPALYPSHGTGTDQTVAQCFTPSALLPSAGSAAGGNQVQINGTGFTGATAVKFGAVPAQSFTVASDSRIIAVAPPGSGSVAVSIVKPDGTITSPSLGQYTYLTVSSVSPSNGPKAGGTTVTITGSGFVNLAAVYIGGVSASFAVDSGTQITAITPAGTGTGTVTVLTQDGGVSGPAGPAFRYGSGAGALRTEPAPQMPAVIPAVASGGHRPGGLIGALNKFSPQAQALSQAQSFIADMAAQCGAGYSFGNAFTRAADQWMSDFSSDWGWSQLKDLSAQSFGKILARTTGKQAFADGVPTAVASYDFTQAVRSIEQDLSATGQNLSKLLNCFWNTVPHPDHGLPTFNFDFRIDPSGTVEDTSGQPVSGATVTLQQAASKLGPFIAPPSGSPIMAPSVNPETTGANGAFHWDAFAGYYKVTATKAGCAQPGHADQPVVSSAVFRIPPPKAGIVLVLQCQGQTGPDRPTVTGLSSANGPARGGTELDVLGSAFTAGSVVKFGKAKATVDAVLSPGDLLVTAPRGSGTVAVTVTTAHGTSPPSAKDRYAYVAPVRVSRLAPSHGSERGGTIVKITGSGFSTGDQVAFGALPAKSVAVASTTEILAAAPQGAGTVSVAVTNLDGPSATSAASEFRYAGRPVFSSAAALSATKGKTVSFTITAGGYPAPVLSETGRLPAGLTFHRRQGGVATITGKPATAGRYRVTIKATNRYGTVKQELVITVRSRRPASVNHLMRREHRQRFTVTAITVRRFDFVR